MSKLLLNQEQRQEVRFGTPTGTVIKLDLSCKRLLRDVYRQDGWISMKKAERAIVRMANIKLLNMDAPKKWWQLF